MQHDIARFNAWTFEQELDLLEEYDGDFDRDAPNADLSIASFALELKRAGDLIPKFLGYDMQWWVSLCCDRPSIQEPGGLLDHLGIRDAVLAWLRDEKVWERRRSAARRKATRQGRSWLGEMIPEIR